MPDHEDAHRDLGGYVLGVLEPAETASFEAHLAGCQACRDELAELSGLRELLEHAAPAVEVPRHLEERTLAAIDRAAEDDAPIGRPLLVGQQREREPERGRPRRMIAVRRVLAVAAAVVVLGAGAAVVRDVSQPEPALAQVIELAAPAGRTGRAVARVRTTGTGGVIEMDVEGLAQPPPGYFYECWLVSSQGDSIERPNRVSVGTFSVDANGRTTVRWDFTAPGQFSRMGVTLEPDDGNPLQTTDRVLAAKRLLDR